MPYFWPNKAAPRSGEDFCRSASELCDVLRPYGDEFGAAAEDVVAERGQRTISKTHEVCGQPLLMPRL